MEVLENSNKKLQTLIEVGNVLWDNNWNWTVIKQEIDFAETTNGSFEVGVATFVNIILLPNRLERQNVGYSHITHGEKGFAYNLARKTSIIAALQETMCSFGGEISNKIHIALQNKVDTITKSTENSPTNAIILNNGKNENHPSKSNDPIKPKSPGKSRFTPKTYTDNSIQNNSAGNMNFNPIKVPPAMPINVPGNLERNNAIPARAGNTTAQFPAPKTSPTSIVTFNSKTGPLPITTHGKPPLQQIPSNIITHDVSNVISNNIQGNCFNPKPLMKTIFLNQNTISYNNCHIQQDSHMFNNQVLSYQNPNKNNFVNNEWITPTIFHDGFWTENKVKLWANQNDLIHLTPTGDGSKC